MMMGGFGMFGWLFGFLFMLLFLGAFILAAVWLIRQVSAASAGRPDHTGVFPPASSGGRTCPTCGRPVQPGWTVCPYDGTSLSE